MARPVQGTSLPPALTKACLTFPALQLDGSTKVFTLDRFDPKAAAAQLGPGPGAGACPDPQQVPAGSKAPFYLGTATAAYQVEVRSCAVPLLFHGEGCCARCRSTAPPSRFGCWDTISQKVPFTAAARYPQGRTPCALTVLGSGKVAVMPALPAGRRQEGRARRIYLGRVLAHAGQNV